MRKLLVTLLILITVGCANKAQVTPVAVQSSSTPVTAQPSATPVVDAPLSLMGKFSLSPDHGAEGTKVTANGAGLAPNAKYDLVWSSVEGSWKLANNDTEYVGREYKPTEKILGSVNTDAQGDFQTTFVVPADFGFQHDVLVRDGNVIRNKSGFDVDLQISISPKSGPVGTPITIEAKGIGWRQMENSWLVSYDNKFTGWLSAVTTKGYAKAVIPATGQPGVHEITVLHGDFTFPYLNMQQSPEPDRPQFHIPFTVTEGTPVLPPDPATQSLLVKKGLPTQNGAGISVEPQEGIVGSQATVAGKTLPPNTEVELTWSSVTGNRVSGGGWEEHTRTLAKTKTDANGNLDWKLVVPDDLGGIHTIGLKAGDKDLGKTSFTIQPSAKKLSVDRGPSGTQFMIQLNGVGWTETANIYNIVYDNAYAGYACGFNSGGNVQVFMRASGAPGWHFIDLYPGIYKGKEKRPLDFRIPQLTFAADHPGESLPAFHFAFYITK